MSSCVKCSAANNWRFIVSYCIKCGHDPSAIVAASWTFVVAELLVVSLNRQGTNRGGKRFAYRGARDNWAWLIKSKRIEQRIPSAIALRRLTLTRLYTGRERELDRDNLIGGCKMIVDAIVGQALLLDDKPKSAEIHYLQQRAESSGLRVLLEELA